MWLEGGALGFLVCLGFYFFDLPLLLLKVCALGMVEQELVPHPLVTRQLRRSRRRWPCWCTLLTAMLGEKLPASSPMLQH